MHVSTFSSVRALRGLLLPGRLSAVPNFLNFTSSLSVIYKLPSVVTFTFIQTFDQDLVFFTERRHGLQGM